MNLYPDFRLGDLMLTEYPYAVEFGTDHGAPESVEAVAAAMIADGDLVDVERYGNREIKLVVHIEGADHLELARNAAILRAECAKPLNALTVTPGDDIGPASVFDTFTARMRLVRDDEQESAHLHRWELTIPAAPFARSADLTVAEALNDPEAEFVSEVIDPCTSTAGWSGSRSGPGSPALGIWDGGVGVVDLDSAITSPETWRLVRTGAVNFGTLPYLVVEARTVSNFHDLVRVYADNRELTLLEMRALDGTWFRFVYQGAGSASSLTFVHESSPGEAWQGLVVRELTQQNKPPAETVRQVSRIIPVGGTERTTGSIEVFSRQGSAMGLTMVHTSPVIAGVSAGYAPPLRPFRTAGNAVTQDSSMLSGAREPLRPASFVARVPNNALPPGPYFVAARIHSDAAMTAQVTWTVRTLSGGLDLHGQISRSSVAFDFPAGEYSVVPLGIITLPVAQAANAITQVDIRQDSGAGNLTLDDAYLFWASEDCGFTMLTNAKSRVWLDSPDLSSAVPTYWTGDAADGSDRHHPGAGLLAPGLHQLLPGQVQVWTATTGTTYPAARITHYKRWHTNAAE